MMRRWFALGWSIVAVCAGAQAPPMSSVEAAGWDVDLTALVESYLPYDKSFDVSERELFQERIEVIRDGLATMAETKAIVEIADAVAISNNAESAARIFDHPLMATQLPIQFYWFEEGAYIIRATPEWADLVMSRVRAIEGVPVEDLQDRVAALIPGNASWKRYRGPVYMACPGVLQGLGVIASLDAVSVSCDLINGEQAEVVLEPISAGPDGDRIEVWQGLAPTFTDPAVKWMRAIDRQWYAAPLAFQRPANHYWFQYLPQHRALYVQYNRCEMVPGEPVPHFITKVDRAIAEHAPTRVIIDLRFNTGGDGVLAERLFIRLSNYENFDVPGGRIVLLGRQTHSAGITHAAYMKQAGNALFIGETPGGDRTFWAQTRVIALPYSGLPILCSGALHFYADDSEPPGGERPTKRLSIATLEPDISVPVTWVDYLTGKDAALDAALSYAPPLSE